MSDTTSFQFNSDHPGDTDRLGQAIGERLQPGTVIGLDGTLGAGKTRLTQAIGMGIGIASGNVVSPTFTIMVPHSGRLELIHLDAYRIKSPEEVDELGLDELIADGAVLAVEWVERIAHLLPAVDLHIEIRLTGDQSRQFLLAGKSESGKTLLREICSRISG